MQNRAGTYWYHPHPDRTTGGQVYRGLAGLFLVGDAEEAALALPRDEQDIALVLQDRAFDDTGQLVYGGNDPVRGAQDDGFYGNGHTQSMGMAGKPDSGQRPNWVFYLGDDSCTPVTHTQRFEFAYVCAGLEQPNADDRDRDRRRPTRSTG